MTYEINKDGKVYKSQEIKLDITGTMGKCTLNWDADGNSDCFEMTESKGTVNLTYNCNEGFGSQKVTFAVNNPYGGEVTNTTVTVSNCKVDFGEGYTVSDDSVSYSISGNSGFALDLSKSTETITIMETGLDGQVVMSFDLTVSYEYLEGHPQTETRHVVLTVNPYVAD